MKMEASGTLVLFPFLLDQSTEGHFRCFLTSKNPVGGLTDCTGPRVAVPATISELVLLSDDEVMERTLDSASNIGDCTRGLLQGPSLHFGTTHLEGLGCSYLGLFEMPDRHGWVLLRRGFFPGVPVASTYGLFSCGRQDHVSCTNGPLPPNNAAAVICTPAKFPESQSDFEWRRWVPLGCQASPTYIRVFSGKRKRSVSEIEWQPKMPFLLGRPPHQVDQVVKSTLQEDYMSEWMGGGREGGMDSWVDEGTSSLPLQWPVTCNLATDPIGGQVGNWTKVEVPSGKGSAGKKWWGWDRRPKSPLKGRLDEWMALSTNRWMIWHTANPSGVLPVCPTMLQEEPSWSEQKVKTVGHGWKGFAVSTRVRKPFHQHPCKRSSPLQLPLPLFLPRDHQAAGQLVGFFSSNKVSGVHATCFQAKPPTLLAGKGDPFSLASERVCKTKKGAAKTHHIRLASERAELRALLSLLVGRYLRTWMGKEI
ncbi:hypothetical protein L345_05851, partial [Ophiophagus hannah]